MTATKGPLIQTLRFPSVATMALRRNVLQEDDILCELYADTLSNVCDSSDNVSLDSDSDISATSSCKQLQSYVVVVISDSETSTREEDVVNRRTVMIKLVMCGVKLIKKTKQ